jgi:predicted enzyme related to lactoylglutathione lyase
MKSDGNPLARHGGLSYLEIPAADPRRSATFYEQVLGWRIDRRSDDDLRFMDAKGLLLGRFAIDRAPSREPGWSPVFYVDGLDAAIARAVAAGGEVVQAIRPEGDVRVARLRDPAGNQLGLWQFASS